MSGIELKQADNGFWYVHWSDGRRSKRISARTKDASTARAFLATWLMCEKEGEAQRAAGPTCADLWATYLRDHVVKKCANIVDFEIRWRALKPTFAALRPAEITQAIVDRHIASRWPTKPSSLFVELSLLSASWRFAVKHRVIASTELPVLKLPDAPEPRDRWLREDEADKLFAAAAELRAGPRLSRIERFMHLALETGSRRTALLELRWGQVDFETRVIHLNPTGRKQTSKRRASVPISQALLPVLRQAWNERVNDFVLDTDTRLNEQLDAVAARAGVEGVTPHVFRHTAATWMARRDVPLWKIAKVLGNSVEQVERTYAKHSPGDLRDSVDTISQPRVVAAQEVGRSAQNLVSAVCSV